MTKNDNQVAAGPACTRPVPDMSEVTVMELNTEAPLKDHIEAMELAKEEALKHIDDCMLMS